MFACIACPLKAWRRRKHANLGRRNAVVCCGNFGGEVGAADKIGLLLRWSSDKMAVARDYSGCGRGRDSEEKRFAEDFERVNQLLAHAPADRGSCWRGLVVMCCRLQ